CARVYESFRLREARGTRWRRRLLGEVRGVEENVFFFKQKTAYDIGLGIPAEPLFRSQLIRNGRSASLQRTFKKSFTSFSHSTRNKTRDGLIRVRNIRALNGRFNTSITHAYSIVIGSKHITLNATGGGFLT